MVKPQGLAHLGTVLTLLSKNKFIICHLRLARLDSENSLTLSSTFDQSNLSGGPSAILEVLKMGAVEGVQQLIANDFKKNIGVEGVFFSPSTLQAAQEVPQ